MSVLNAVWMFMAASMILCLILFLPRLYRNRAYKNTNIVMPSINMAAIMIFLAVGGIILAKTQVPLAVRIFGPIFVQISAVLSFIVHDKLFNNQSNLHSQAFTLAPAIVLMVLEVVLDVMRGTNDVWFMSGQEFIPNATYYAFHLVCFSINLYLSVVIAVLLYKGLKSQQEIDVVIRMMMGFLGFCFVVIGLIVIELTIVLSMIYDDTYRTLGSAIFFFFIALMSVAFLLYAALPPRFYQWVSRCFLSYRDRRRQKLEHFLRHVLTWITPGVQHRPSRYSAQRTRVEINQSRYVIYTHHPFVAPVTPNQEVSTIIYCLKNYVQYHQVGPAIPQPTSSDVSHHNMVVATKLRRLMRWRYIPMGKPIPTLPGWPLLGRLHDFRHNRLQLLMDVAQRCGPIGQFSMGPLNSVVLSTPAYVQQVFVDHAYDFVTNPLFRRSLLPLLGNGLLTGDHNGHPQHRRLLAPAFQHRRIGAYATTMAQIADAHQRAWADGQPVDIIQAMHAITLDIVAQTLFGTAVEQEAESLRVAMNAVSQHVNAAFSALVSLPSHWPTPGNRRFQRIIAQLEHIVQGMIAQRRATGADRGDFLSMLIQIQHENPEMSDQQIRDDVMTMFLAGHETTTVALCWVWYLLAQHPAVYAQLCAEVDQVLGGRLPTNDDLPQLAYTLQVVKESMRLYPPIYLIARQPNHPVGIDGYRLTPDMLVLISPYVLHRDPEAFPDPERFVPERFAPAQEKRIPRHAYLPFGAGPHICIGNHFALVETQIIVATLLQTVRFDLAQPHVATDPLITLRPRGPMWARVSRRTTAAPLEVVRSGRDGIHGDGGHR